MAYSVLTEPFFPVVDLNGEYKEIGLKELFLNAHQYKTINGDNPLERYALLRLVISFAMDMYVLRTSADRRILFNSGRFTEEVFDSYIAECEKDGPRFELFHDTHPFLQAAYDEKKDVNAEKPIAILFHTLPSGNNHIFRDHRQVTQHAKTPAQAFRALCATYVFCVAGAQGYPSGVNNTPPVYVVVEGKNLFETIVLNMVAEKECGNIKYGIGSVPWRSSQNVEPKLEFADITELQGLTWIPRRITLKLDSDGLLRTIYLQQGHNFKGNDLWRDPHVPRRKAKDSFVTVKPEQGKSLWRDIGSVVYDQQGTYAEPPLCLRCLGNILDDEDMPAMINLRMVGLSTSNASYLDWQECELAIPSCLMNDWEKAEMFRSDILSIESIRSSIYSSVAKHCKAETGLQAQNEFLKLSREVLFGSILDKLAYETSFSNHIDSFDGAVSPIINRVLDDIVYKSGNTVADMIAQVDIANCIWKQYRNEIDKRRDACV